MGVNDPPVLKDGDCYTTWKRKIAIWECGTTLEGNKLGSRVIQAVQGKAQDYANRIAIEKIKATNSVELVLNELDKHFKKDENQTAFVTAENFENYRRTHESISEYIEEFTRRKNLVDECEAFGEGSYTDGILAYRLLKQAELSNSENQLIRATIPKLTFENMVETMKKTLGDIVIMEGTGNSKKNVSFDFPIKHDPIKQEPTFFAEDEEHEESQEEATQFYENNYHGNRKYSGNNKPYYNSGNNNRADYYNQKRGNSQHQRGRGRGSNNYKSSYNNQMNNNSYSTPNQANNQRNSGKQCFNCKSIYHLKKDCPDLGKSKPDERTYFQKATEKYEMIDEDYEAVLLVNGTQRQALIDSGCVFSVCGREWAKDYMNSIQSGKKCKIIPAKEKKNFRFGDGRLQESSETLTIWIHMCGKDFKLNTYVVDGDIPLLMSRNALKDYGAIIDFKDDVIMIDGVTQELIITESGHYVIDIQNSAKNDHDYCYEDIVMLCGEEKDPKKAAIKLHRYFGHPSSKRLKEMVKGSELDQRIVQHIKELECETCIRFRKERPKPKSSMMMSSEFNDIVGMDLKKLSTGHLMIHMVDLFSRFSATEIINNKKQETIIEAMFKIWISIFGRSKLIFSDNGGEFFNESFIAMCEDLGVKVRKTAADSPFSNGLCERHNGLIAEIYDKIIEDVNCSPKIALAWATNSKNSYLNSYGFSPYTLVLGKTPNIPGLDNIRLVTELNESTVSKLLADHLNAMYLSRQAYMKAMQSDRLKRALKDKITFQDEKYFIGDQVYFKRKDQKRWQGPASVLGQDGKVVVVRHGGFILRVHASRVVLSSRAEREILQECMNREENENISQNTGLNREDQEGSNQEEEVEESDGEESEERPSNVQTSVKEPNSDGEESEERPLEVQRPIEIRSGEQLVESEDLITSDLNQEDHSSNSKWKSVSFKKNGVLDLKEGDKVRMRDEEEDDWEEATVIGPAGKVGGKNQNLFNMVKSDDTLHLCHLDQMQTEILNETISMYIEENISFAVNIPKDRYNEPKIKEAMEAEMQRWKDYGTYREIYDRGQKTISTRWVITEKKEGFKARLVVRGFEEIEEVGQADSPTGDKATLRLVLTLAASENWKLQSIDIKSAYLQADKLDRDVFVRPPKELKRPGLIWALDKPAYGLIDSARNWYSSISSFLISQGCKRCIYDKALFFYSVGNKLCGLIMMHVDDFIFCGSVKFLNDILKPLKAKYDISKHETEIFKYIGIEILQTNAGIVLDQKQYLQCVQPVKVNATRQHEAGERLNKEEQTQYLSLLGKISWLAQITRPDLKFDVYQYAKHNKSTTVQNLLDLNGVVSKANNQQKSMYFNKLDKSKPWKIAVYADASFANLDNKVNSARGYIVLLGDGQRACILTWNANKVSRVVTSTLESETLALRDGIRHAELLRTILCAVKYNEECDKGVLPIIGFTDSDQLWKSVHSSKRCKDVALHRDICVLQEKIKEGILSELRHVGTNEQIADCLTKKGAHPKKLAVLIETGLWTI